MQLQLMLSQHIKKRKEDKKMIKTLSELNLTEEQSAVFTKAREWAFIMVMIKSK